jgi:hypothetical protein
MQEPVFVLQPPFPILEGSTYHLHELTGNTDLLPSQVPEARLERE